MWTRGAKKHSQMIFHIFKCQAIYCRSGNFRVFREFVILRLFVKSIIINSLIVALL